MTDKQLLYAQQLIESDEQHRYNAYTKFGSVQESEESLD
jgi:hypothetical protein